MDKIDEILNNINRKWNMAQALIYFCGKNGELLPTKECFFLTEFVCALNEFLTKKEEFNSFRDMDYMDWGNFLNKKLSSIFSSLKSGKNIFSDQLTDDLEEMTKLTWNSDYYGDGEYTCLFLTGYKGVRDSSGWYGSTFCLRPKEIDKLKEKLTSIADPKFLEFCQEIASIIRKYIDNDINPENHLLKGYYW